MVAYVWTMEFIGEMKKHPTEEEIIAMVEFFFEKIKK